MLDRLLGLGLLPDWLLRWGIRRICQQRLVEQSRGGADLKNEFLSTMRFGPLALATTAANEQHYEIPASFYQLVLGPNLKYSSAYWPKGVETLADAEDAMLALTMERAQLVDGQHILELGCGWGSLSLAMAKRFPEAKVTAVSNSHSQRMYVMSRARAMNISNLQVLTCDINHFAPSVTFDRIVSVEMFEHMRNYDQLLTRIAAWLKPDGLAFVHIFCHRDFIYPYEVKDSSDWMAKYFFTGGLMPSFDVFEHFSHRVATVQSWQVSGKHYQKTAQAWLSNLDARRLQVLDIFSQIYGANDAHQWLNYWRVFFMACAELFGFNGGREWFVGHYLLRSAQNGIEHEWTKAVA